MKITNLFSHAMLFLLLGLVLVSCSAQPSLTAGLDLYDTTKSAPIEIMTDLDLTDYLIFECEPDGFCKVIIYARNPLDPNGVERYFKSADVPGMGSDNQTAAEPSASSENVDWAKKVLLGQWQIWVLLALAIAGSYALYNWTYKTTPMQASYHFEDLPTERGGFLFGLDVTVYIAESRNPDKARALQHLKGRTLEDKLEEAKAQIGRWFESAVQEVAGTSPPETVESRIRDWVSRVNAFAKNVNWDAIVGTELEGFPDIGVIPLRFRVDGFRPSSDLQNYLNKGSESASHATAIRAFSDKLGISTTQAEKLYTEINHDDTTRDSAGLIKEGLVQLANAIASLFNGGKR